MATVLAGASLMDAVLLIIAANEKCPQPQTKEHLMALDTVGIKDIIIVQTLLGSIIAMRKLLKIQKGDIYIQLPTETEEDIQLVIDVLEWFKEKIEGKREKTLP